MGEIFTTGSWKPSQAGELAFVEAWTEFAAWASSMPGAGTLRLVRDLHEPGRFVSFGDWESIDEVKAWKSSASGWRRFSSTSRSSFRPS